MERVGPRKPPDADIHEIQGRTISCVATSNPYLLYTSEARARDCEEIGAAFVANNTIIMTYYVKNACIKCSKHNGSQIITV